MVRSARRTRTRRRVEDLSEVPLSKLLSEIRKFEAKYGKSFQEFISSLKEDRASMEELADGFLWEQYVNEVLRRSSMGRLELSVEDAMEFTEVFTPARLEIMGYLAKKKEATVSEIARSLRRPVGSVSEMLKILESKGLVKSERRGKRKVYSLLVREILLRMG